MKRLTRVEARRIAATYLGGSADYWPSSHAQPIDT